MDPLSTYNAIIAEIKKHVAGKEDAMRLLLIAVVAGGHVLLEGPPGVAKTTLTKTLSQTINADFKRVQGSPDLEPKDFTGYTYIDEDNKPQFKKGPVFTNMLLIDELNRTTPKTMNSMLEALEERVVTAGGKDFELMKPFTAFATQNPLNVEGTIPLPKVLADRFLMKVDATYPSLEEEQLLIRLKEKNEKLEVNKIIGVEDILRMQEEAKSVELPEELVGYIARLVSATRNDIHVVMGASPRADIAFMQCGKVKAYLEGRNKVTLDDLKFLAKPILTHRIAVRSTGGVGVNGIVDGLVATIE